jgi:hypothetical protein
MTSVVSNHFRNHSMQTSLIQPSLPGPIVFEIPGIDNDQVSLAAANAVKPNLAPSII